jgi:phosphinothricin acetyltransferase
MSIHQDNLSIRMARDTDTQQLLGIYAPFIRDTAVSFEYEVPSATMFWERIAEVLSYCPWLVCEMNGEIAGYAYAGNHRKRVAYQWTTEVSVYISPGYKRRGVGRGLYTALIALLRLQGYKNALAGITLPNEASECFHTTMGFQPVGVYHNVGFKLGQWQDVGWWELSINEMDHLPSPPKTLEAIQGTEAWESALQAGVAHLKI